MAVLGQFARLTPPQRHAFFAALAGWTLDAFDFFIFVLCLTAISADFKVPVKAVAQGIAWTLAMRPLGALFFGWLAEKYGRKPILTINVLCYSALELASAFAPDLTTLLVLRALFGFAMGGEWGVGAALALETLPAKGRGFFSGLLQEGYALGFLLASLVSRFAFAHIGWRGMFIVGAMPAVLAWYIVRHVDESPGWAAGAHQRRASVAEIWSAVKGNAALLVYMVLLMACFNAFSHGSQDLYKPFLQKQRGFAPALADNILIVMNLGALVGGICFGAWSERIGRKRAIALAAALAVPLIPLWALASGPLMLAAGAFLMQFMVQGAWGIVPAHINELSPAAVRSILPGFAYQLGNFLMSQLSPLQAGYAEAHGDNYALMLAATIGVVGVLLAAVSLAGPQSQGVDMGAATDASTIRRSAL